MLLCYSIVHYMTYPAAISVPQEAAGIGKGP